ncbi:bifunctional enoyl-CoA hydratase/phosphate acetyltransferase [Celeribacter halophilus]|uniref:Bifunctional enoyl-CoA hydratase/phosphate acetyltransferase n=1 Tax=Celeribacter halophilus TaxID=576117 RepID=A0AAW7XX51_9RHOB|nr:bifunctional enoyl-CoA hydratase/phosphate acetyltransferase [Celeribacter halophilus]MDO6458266.1 bifunctional enoyl-CoA hydratase/phosphate acetyltransferase [Celeribacter halophilus]MDO6724235.1 bifunctional enoyl-CoA hydratase/phosphate acetyltransferase [Celeribacter halophilus]
MTIFQNTPFDQLEVGMEAEVRRLCVADDLYVFAHASGNLNPMHLPKEDGDRDGKPESVAPSSWVGSLISAVLGNKLPGPGTLYKSQNLRFHARAHAGDELIARVKLIRKGDNRSATFETTVTLADGTVLIDGETVVIAPATKESFDIHDVPGLTVESHRHFDKLLEMSEDLPATRMAVVAPEEENALRGAMMAAEHKLIQPTLLGDQDKIHSTAKALGITLDKIELIHCATHHEAAQLAVTMVRDARANAIMKGHMHTDDLLRPILSSRNGLKTGRRLSHIFVMDVPGLDHLLMVSDAAINIAPDLPAKVDIVQNAIDLAISLGIETPKVGVLSAVETVNPKIPSTLDAAALAKMADRDQIKGGIVDGPLAMDNAISLSAARTKGIKGGVAGHADILIVPNLESGNMLAKELTFIAHAEAAGVVIGARCPIVLNSRSDSDKSRLASCAVAALHAKRAREIT